MTETTRNYDRILGNWFTGVDNDPDGYTEGCESVAKWEREPERSEQLAAFKKELAAHVRDSSDTPLSKRETQWLNDEWLRNLWYDLFGPEPAPGDPYPVPAEEWGHPRETPYIEYAVGDEADSTEAEKAWLAQRGLTHADIRRGYSWRQQPPADYADRLARLTAEGRRTSYDGEV
ncbi:hypothetical protein [Jiangella sp. DSM 45060]|uniref:hypothetical protein n=1 Tax=Jiangella sp. DSM 45060 TaxID=1798224 RepID=UPI00087A3B40|nr:hypothetical protein [Jiangella sp. DSM 45060]SDT55417.1 hypothetical protein SAMN04515669_4729 [Jiangella sp. DSM 45060]